MTRAHHKLFIDAPFHKVFGFAKDPQNWTSFYNHLAQPSRVSGSGEAGTIVESEFSILGMRFPLAIAVIRCEQTENAGIWEASSPAALQPAR